MQDYTLSLFEVALRLGVALFCGLLLGLERELKYKNAGLRTFLLVSLGAAGFSVGAVEIVNHYASAYEEARIDPTRLIQGLITGIGFLGGGAILQRKDEVTGVATGAAIWICGALGMMCGYGFYWHALIVTAYALVVLTIMGYLRAKLHPDMKDDKGDVANNQEKHNDN